ncbi:MAG: hypothetical protein O2971_16700 [Proteobacteria bacterium]|nr:hypothetical protein [Pseudomonadota bacterium]
MKTTKYFKSLKHRPDRVIIKEEWIRQVLENPEKKIVQADRRIRLTSRISEAGNRYLRVVILADRITVHNAFFDGVSSHKIELF